MAGARITVEAEGGALVLDTLERLRDMGTRMRPVFADLGEYLLQSHAERWEQEESPEGEPWAPLSEAYAARKAAQGKPDKILVLDGYLELLHYDATDEELFFGTSRIYGATHQFGDADRGIPARPFLGLSEDDREEVLTIVTGWLEGLIAGTS